MTGCSIIIPSRNGADTLGAALAALAQVERPEGAGGNGAWDIVLIDNASSDATPDIMRRFATAHGAQFLSEPRPGKSHALNRGIAAARGDLLIFMDDDVLPVPRWAQAYVEAAESSPHVGVFAGAVRPHWSAPPPEWLETLAQAGRACGCTDPCRHAGPVDPVDVKGGNFAVRRSALGDVRFDTGATNFGADNLGAGGAPTGGEDSQFVRALAERGQAVHFVPQAIVAHIVGAEEMTLRHQLSRFVRIGRGAAVVDGGGLRGAALAAAKVPVFGARSAMRYARADRAGAAMALAQAAMNLGRLSQSIGKGRV
ncbi:glycosyltransferase [Altererythrobacter sp. FM1]|uniref:glycosyltransferase n=1 Tax=Tsuneonella flava TaxID=2055955 RepID=UPI000C7FC1C6|nr:glycosyltransferase [Tsuneonella flava]ROT93306.1 glycosyltransferase [Altererythrobacter sp. FM1]